MRIRSWCSMGSLTESQHTLTTATRPPSDSETTLLRQLNFPSVLRPNFRAIFTTVSLPPSTPTFHSSSLPSPTPSATPASWAANSWRATLQCQWLRPKTRVTRQISTLLTLATPTRGAPSTCRLVTRYTISQFRYQKINSLLTWWIKYFNVHLKIYKN